MYLRPETQSKTIYAADSIAFVMESFTAEVAENAEFAWRRLTTKNTKTTKSDEIVYEDSFVLFVVFVVKLISGCGPGLRCVPCVVCG